MDLSTYLLTYLHGRELEGAARRALEMYSELVEVDRSMVSKLIGLSVNKK